ncbi:transposase [Micromonospora sp. ZYX-F-536]|uniref:transposase n=1 Tax=Micromonospora sp. ZYX-F-536 TaxID=3457629 RepID=UPI0040409A3D
MGPPPPAAAVDHHLSPAQRMWRCASASVQDRARAKLVLGSITDEHPYIELIWADGGYANSVEASLIDWADQELGIRLEIVKHNDDVKGFQVLPRRWVVERSSTCRGARSMTPARSRCSGGPHCGSTVLTPPPRMLRPLPAA